jgi:hemerythrin-like metal-binding protein
MITWTPALETGHPIIDRDHRQLIDTLNSLEDALKKGAGKEEMGRIIGFLNTYTREHFRREEGYMQQVRCPAHGTNCSAHAELVKKLDGWVQQLNTTGATTLLVLTVFREANQWIHQHILKVDCRLKGCARLNAA